MLERVVNTMIGHIAGDVVGDRLQAVSRVAHRDADMTILEEFQVIPRVAEGDGVFPVDTKRFISA